MSEPTRSAEEQGEPRGPQAGADPRTGQDPKLLCVGEALMDVVSQPRRTSEHVGGSLLNVACGLGRLGHDCTLQTWFARDERGEQLRAWIEQAGVRLGPGSQQARRTPVAHAELDLHGHANYTFELDWELPELPDHRGFGHLHTGSFACTLAPGADQVLELVRQMSGHATVSYDPNVRPDLMHRAEAVRERIEEIVGLSDVVKASDEDLEWLYGDLALDELIARWLELGPQLVVITRGPWGAVAGLAAQTERLTVDQVTVSVGDTVGAGDSFMAGLLSGLVEADLVGSREAAARLSRASWDEVRPALQRAVATAAITVSHDGAYSPDPAEVSALLDQREVATEPS